MEIRQPLEWNCCILWSMQWKLMHYTICVYCCILLPRLKIVFFLSPEIKKNKLTLIADINW